MSVGLQQPQDVIDQSIGCRVGVVAAGVVSLSRTGVVLGFVPVAATTGVLAREGAVGFVPVVGAAVMRCRTVVGDGFGGIGVAVARGRPDSRGEGVVHVVVVVC
ncbi:MAG TPA: hypothetical protein VGF00_05270, partial [Acidimicrobiia bacterium]